MATKICLSCGSEIDETASFCPNCGAKQPLIYDPQSGQSFNSFAPQKEKISTNKILSFVALGLSIISIVIGGLFAEIAAIVISIIVLNSKDRCEPEAKTISKVAIVISAILLVLRIALLFWLGTMVSSVYKNIFNLMR